MKLNVCCKMGSQHIRFFNTKIMILKVKIVKIEILRKIVGGRWDYGS